MNAIGAVLQCALFFVYRVIQICRAPFVILPSSPTLTMGNHPVDKLLHQAGTFRENQQIAERVMDSNDTEKSAALPFWPEHCGKLPKVPTSTSSIHRGTPILAAR